ncbi:Uncharacterised protein [Vibrio cholerae]|nr:Uncharacterised protein [Vibrio cholerae]
MFWPSTAFEICSSHQRAMFSNRVSPPLPLAVSIKSIFIDSGITAPASLAMRPMALISVLISPSLAFAPYLPTRTGIPNTSANAHQSRTVNDLSMYITATKRARPLRHTLPDLERGVCTMNL